ncbi:NUDIX hydrolase [Nocardiopsis sp. CNT312]|uniref:NUDIX hydrolase n=1 Tax=Nocardiopsis sp. CNT312 TaxID=1137268 RepID=UPI0004B9B938|nr:NUDIX hydrolase [Nocardiopsis sp. CNT312]
MDTPLAAAGGLVTRPGDSGPEFAVIHRPRHGDWSFPKGKRDPGEALEQTALREVWEETALRCRLGRPLGSASYPGKIVHYWAMTVEEAGAFEPGEEVDAVRWVPAAEAAALLSHEQDRELLAAFLDGA